MALTPRLEIRQTQTLVMTPQLQQAIKLLQYSNLELASFVDQEVEKNPLLEVEGAPETQEPDQTAEASDWREEGGEAPQSPEVEAPEPPGVDAKLVASGTTAAGDDTRLDTGFENVFSNDSPSDGVPGDGSAVWTGVNGSGQFDDFDHRLEQVLGQTTTLRTHLLEQLPGMLLEPMDQLISRYLIDVIDSDGYLTEDIEAIAEQLGCEAGHVAKTLKSMQSLSPAGVFACDLKECLALQLAERDRLDPVMKIFLDNLDLVAKHDIPALKRTCNVDIEDLTQMIAEIRSLNPKPGGAFYSEPVQPVIPDVFVRQSPEGGWTVELNSETLPRVLVNRRYFAEIDKSAKSSDDKAYLVDCLTTANWLVKALDQRARTILKVASEIVRQQDAFLVNGVHYLKPMNLRVVAQAIEMHESTVSRVTNNKYMATHRGIFELKYFFTSAVGSEATGHLHSAEAIRHRIKQLVDRESVNSVLSDDKMVEVLKASGVDIARRTVAKYRESIHIPSSVQRRRLKRMQKAMEHGPKAGN